MLIHSRKLECVLSRLESDLIMTDSRDALAVVYVRIYEGSYFYSLNYDFHRQAAFVTCTNLLTPWSRVLLEKLTSKLCR